MALLMGLTRKGLAQPYVKPPTDADDRQEPPLKSDAAAALQWLHAALDVEIVVRAALSTIVVQ